MRRAARQDKNHRAIATYLRDHGCEVLEILRPLDLLIRHGKFVSFVEVKDDTAKKQMYTAVQLKFIAETRFNVIFATSEEQTLLDVQDRHTLSDEQKRAITGLLLRTPKAAYTAKDLREIL